MPPTLIVIGRAGGVRFAVGAGGGRAEALRSFGWWTAESASALAVE